MAQVVGTTKISKVLTTKTVENDKVVNMQGEDLGKIEDLMLDLEKG